MDGGLIGSTFIGVVVGMLIGRFFREPPEVCPSIVLGYECKGIDCDHRESELYQAKAQMALLAEKREDHNYWSGNDE